MRRKHAWLTWAAVIAGAIWVTRRHLQAQAAHEVLPADFDDGFFVQEAAALGRRERRWASRVLRASSDESLRALARMALAQHQSADGVWMGFGTESDATESEQTSIAYPAETSGDDHELAFELQGILDEAWPLFDQASQRSEDAALRDRALRMLAWLEEAEQTLAQVIENLPAAGAQAFRSDAILP